MNVIVNVKFKLDAAAFVSDPIARYCTPASDVYGLRWATKRPHHTWILFHQPSKKKIPVYEKKLSI